MIFGSAMQLNYSCHTVIVGWEGGQWAYRGGGVYYPVCSHRPVMYVLSSAQLDARSRFHEALRLTKAGLFD